MCSTGETGTLFFLGEKSGPLAFDEFEAKLKSKILSLIQFDFSCVLVRSGRVATYLLSVKDLVLFARECLLLMHLYRMIFSQKCTDLTQILCAFSSFLDFVRFIITNQLDCETNLHDYCTK